MSNKDKIFTVSVFNTTTNAYEIVEVSEAVHKVMEKTEWEIKNNNKSFYKHEIQLSVLIGGEEDSYEKFGEFIVEENNVLNSVLQKERYGELYNALNRLTEPRKRRVIRHYLFGFSLEKIANLEGVKKSTVKWSLEEGKRELKKILKNFQK